MTNQKIIFFGNGPLADYALETLKSNGCEIVFHAHNKSDLEEVKRLKSADKAGHLHAVLASFGVIIKQDVLDLFEPEGILNIHPSLLPKYRGPSPIESAILNGDTTLSVSVMKLVAAMDAGPIYHQETFTFSRPEKNQVYHTLATAAADWIAKHLKNRPLSEVVSSTSQDDSLATYTEKFDKSRSELDPSHKTASELDCEIRAFAGFPKSKFSFYGLDCIVISAHVATPEEAAKCTPDAKTLCLKCYDNSVLIIDQIQPAGRKIMDAKSFLNGYAK